MAQDPPELPRDVGERAANALAPESGVFEDLDSAGFGDALARVARFWAENPVARAEASSRLAADLARIPLVTLAAWLGSDQIEPPVPVDAKDRRFADPAWSANPYFQGVRLTYLAACKAARDVVASAGLVLREGEEVDRKLLELRRMYEPYVNSMAQFLFMTLPPW